MKNIAVRRRFWCAKTKIWQAKNCWIKASPISFKTTKNL